jgi:hypothetical protein
MTDGDGAEKAFIRAEMASDESVTMALLAGRESRFSKAEPLNDPPVKYLEETEAPAFALTNAKRGVGLGVKTNTVTPDGERRTVVLVTGRRTICLVGQADADEVIEIPHESVVQATYSTGFRKHRVALRTPQSAYHCWVHRKTDQSLLERVTEFIGDHRTDDPVEIDDDSPSRVMYRGRPVQRSTPEESTDIIDADGDGAESSDFIVTYRGQPVERD